MSNLNPCMTCGACCAFFRVSFYWAEANGETTKDDKWTQIIDGMTIYTDTALKEYLEKAGFCQIQSHKNKKGWLCVTAQKR